MNRVHRFASTRLAAAALALGLVAACGQAANAPPTLGGETHFLRSCSESCGDGLACIGGICTRGCLVAEASCGDLARDATCTAASVEPGAVAVCDLGCSVTGDCSALGSDYSCQAGFCRAPALGGASAAACPSFPAGVLTPTPIESSAAVIPGAANVQRAIADDTGLYWIDADGVVFGLKRGASAPEPLNAPLPPPVAITSLVSDASQLYWGRSSMAGSAANPGPPLPPGRLEAVSKTGGGAVLLAESETRMFAPLDSNGQVITEYASGEPGIFAVPTAGGDVVRLLDELPSSERALRGDAIYYLEGLEAATLYSMPLDGGPAQPVLPIDGREFELGPGVIVWKKGPTAANPFIAAESLAVLDEATGCINDLPSSGESISIAGLDADHVYWKSNGIVGPVSPDDLAAALPLLRVHLRTGAFERLVTPGFAPTIATDYLTQDESAIYFRADGGIVAVQKP